MVEEEESSAPAVECRRAEEEEREKRRTVLCVKSGSNGSNNDKNDFLTLRCLSVARGFSFSLAFSSHGREMTRERRIIGSTTKSKLTRPYCSQ